MRYRNTIDIDQAPSERRAVHLGRTPYRLQHGVHYDPGRQNTEKKISLVNQSRNRDPEVKSGPTTEKTTATTTQNISEIDHHHGC